MWWWNGFHPMWGMWVFPLIGLVFMIVCLFAISRFFRGGVSFCVGRSHGEIQDLRREIRDLKDEVAKFRKKD